MCAHAHAGLGTGRGGGTLNSGPLLGTAESHCHMLRPNMSHSLKWILNSLAIYVKPLMPALGSRCLILSTANSSAVKPTLMVFSASSLFKESIVVLVLGLGVSC